MKFFDKFKKQNAPSEAVVYTVDDMHCNHCKAAVESAVLKVKGVESAEANVSAKTLTVTGNADAEYIRKAVEEAGFSFKGRKE